MKIHWPIAALWFVTAAAFGDQLPKPNTWASVAMTCRVAGANYCQTWAAGSSETLVEEHRVCPGRHLDPPEIWTIVDTYYAERSNLDLRREGLSSLASLVRKAAVSRFPCPPTH